MEKNYVNDLHFLTAEPNISAAILESAKLFKPTLPGGGVDSQNLEAAASRPA